MFDHIPFPSPNHPGRGNKNLKRQISHFSYIQMLAFKL